MPNVPKARSKDNLWEITAMFAISHILSQQGKRFLRFFLNKTS
jgi:hypothetical protein